MTSGHARIETPFFVATMGFRQDLSLGPDRIPAPTTMSCWCHARGVGVSSGCRRPLRRQRVGVVSGVVLLASGPPGSEA